MARRVVERTSNQCIIILPALLKGAYGMARVMIGCSSRSFESGAPMLFRHPSLAMMHQIKKGPPYRP